MRYAKGIDTSTFQDNSLTPQRIDWSKPKENGVSFVINRVSIDKYIDEDFIYNWNEQGKYGYIRSGYGFWDYRPGTLSVKDQALLFVKTIKSVGLGEMPVYWMDFEHPISSWPALPFRDICLSSISTYMKTVEDGLGKECGIYTRPSHIKYDLSLFSGTNCVIPVPEWLRKKKLWIAAWPEVPVGEKAETYIERVNWKPNLYNQWSDWFLWQYGTPAEGTIMGMESKDIDVDFYNGSEQELITLCSKVEDTTNGDVNMWEKNALIVSFDAIGSSAPVTNIDFVALKKAGVHAVILRCGTSDDKLNYDQPDASYLSNIRYGQWFRAATAAGLKVIIDYDFNAMLDCVNSYDGSVTKRHINNLISGGMKPSIGGGMLLNLERNTWTEGGKPKTCVSSMYSKDLKNVFDAMWNAHKLVPGIRTGRWFFDKTDESSTSIRSQIEWMDKGDASIPLFLARPKLNGIVTTGDLHDTIKNISDPLVTYVKVGETQVNEQAYYLYFGNKTKWSGWEVAWIKNSAVIDMLGNTALFRLIIWNGTPAQFNTYFNYTDEVIVDNGGGEIPPVVDNSLLQRIIALETKYNDLVTKLRNV